MFRSLVLHGGRATLLWGYQSAAELRDWRITRSASGWSLAGTLDSYASHRLLKTPLYFTAPRDKGRWCFPIIGEVTIDGNQVRAPLGPPEQ